MNALAVFAIYAIMTVYDFSIIAGTVYLIVERGWSAWWIACALLICGASNPRPIILAAQRYDEGEP